MTSFLKVDWGEGAGVGGGAGVTPKQLCTIWPCTWVSGSFIPHAIRHNQKSIPIKIASITTLTTLRNFTTHWKEPTGRGFVSDAECQTQFWAHCSRFLLCPRDLFVWNPPLRRQKRIPRKVHRRKEESGTWKTGDVASSTPKSDAVPWGCLP